MYQNVIVYNYLVLFRTLAFRMGLLNLNVSFFYKKKEVGKSSSDSISLEHIKQNHFPTLCIR